MNSLRSRILAGLLIITLFLEAVGLAFLIVSDRLSATLSRYSDAVYTEYAITTDADALVRAFNAYRNAPTPESKAQYETARLALQQRLVSTTSLASTAAERVALVGVRNTIGQLIDATDGGAQAIAASDLSGASDAYDAANNIAAFIPDNVSSLIAEELTVSQDSRALVQQQYNALTKFTVVAMLLITVLAVIVALFLSRQISRPLEQLTASAHAFAAGDYTTTVPPSALQERGELGLLAQSLATLFGNLTAALGERDRAAREAGAAAASLTKQNALLARLNKLFISREDRIRELKDEIVRLGGTASAADIDVIDAGENSV